MAATPKGKKPEPHKSPPAKPAATKKAAGVAASARAKVQTKTPAKPAKAPVKRPATKKPAAPIKKDSAKPLVDNGLNPKQQRFVDEYLVDLNATQAAIRAGYSADTAGQIGHELLKKPEIQHGLAEARKRQQERTGITADRVIAEIALMAFADARELVEVKKGCCRHCWGEGFKRQRTIGEMNAAMEQWRKNGKDLADFDAEGGIGYNPHRPPHPDCPDCVGEGSARTVLKDTRSLSPAAAALYAGAKEGKDGIEIKMHSKLDAIEKLAKHLGVYEKDNQQKADPLTALLTRIASGNNNEFVPVAIDPERPSTAKPLSPIEPDDED